MMDFLHEFLYAHPDWDKNKQARWWDNYLIVVNDQIKHGVALMQEYSEVLNKTYIQVQLFLQVV